MEFLTVTDLFCKCESPRKILCLCSMSQVLPQDPEREDAPQDSEQLLWQVSPAASAISFLPPRMRVEFPATIGTGAGLNFQGVLDMNSKFGKV